MHLSLPSKEDYTTEEKPGIYREHKKLNYVVEMTASGDVYNFILRVGETRGQRIEGTITLAGKITALKREPSFNTRLICLARGTLIGTPGGSVPVEQLGKGMAVWTVDDSGKRLVAVVDETALTRVPLLFRVVRVILNDCRSVTASTGHPTAAGQALGGYQVGDILDGALVVAVKRLDYDSGAT